MPEHTLCECRGGWRALVCCLVDGVLMWIMFECFVFSVSETTACTNTFTCKLGCYTAIVDSLRCVTSHHHVYEQHCTVKLVSRWETPVTSGQGARGGVRCDGKQFRQAPATERSWRSNLSHSLISLCLMLLCLLCLAEFRALTNIFLFPFSFLWAPTIFVLLIDNIQTCACLSLCRYKRLGHF